MRGNLQFHTFSRRFVYRWYLSMQGMKTWPKMSKYRRMSQKIYSINCGQDGHAYKTNIRTFIHSFYTLPWWCVFLKHKIQCIPIFFLSIPTVHLVSQNRTLRSLVVAFNDFAWHLKAVMAGKNSPRKFSDDLLDLAFINKLECKVKLNFDKFSGRNCCFDAMCLIIFHYFKLGWKWRFFHVNETTWNAFTTGSFK